MNIYYYHGQDTERIWREWREGIFPGHLLYGATHFAAYGLRILQHRPLRSVSRWKRTIYNAWKILTCPQRVDAVFSTSLNGVELLILLRALRLFRKPVVIWHHQPIVTARNRWRERFSRLYYHGIDHALFFSQKLIDDSLPAAKLPAERMHVGHWGADLAYYDRLLRTQPAAERSGFISTGKELRDMPTLVAAFNATGAPLDIYVNRANGSLHYQDIFAHLQPADNVRLHFVRRLIPHELSLCVHRAACVVVCCLPSNYTVGLTTVVEAMALGLPIICSRNPQLPMDIDAEGIGMTVPYGDVSGWQRAITFMQTHPAEAAAMGERGRRLAERLYNVETCARDVAQVLLALPKREAKGTR